MKTLMVVLILLMSSQAYAKDSFILHLGGWSKHWWSSDNITNENHKVVAGEYRGILVGYFENSYGGDSFMLLKTWRWDWRYDLQFSAGAGANYGYDRCYGVDDSSKNICPDGYLGVGYTKYKVVPSVKIKPGVTILTTEIHF